MTENLNLKFGNPSGMAKCWGTEKPKTLELIFEYLITEGFVIPKGMWRDPYSLSLRKDIDETLYIDLSFSNGSQLSEDVYRFDCPLMICSKYVAAIDRLINIWDRNFDQIDFSGGGDGDAIFVVDLSHLKWNEVKGDNPRWVSSNGSSSRMEADAWISDWNRYGKPWLERFVSPKEVVSYLFQLETYKKSDWVRSDGPRSSDKFIFAILLLVQVGRKDDAIKLLNSILHQLDAATHSGLTLSRADLKLKSALLKVMDWINNAYRCKLN